MYFPESASYIPSQQKNVISQQNNFTETNLEAKIKKKLFPILAQREKKPWEQGWVNHVYLVGTTKDHIFDFHAIFFFFFFNCYLADPRPTLGHSQGDSLTNPMLITAF